MASGRNPTRAGLRIEDSGLGDAPGVEVRLLRGSGGVGVRRSGVAADS